MRFQRFESLSLVSAPKPIIKEPAPVPIAASRRPEACWLTAAVILPRASPHHAATDHHGPRLNLMLSRASVTELYWRARPASDCTKTAAASRQMIRRQIELGPSRKA